MVFRTGSVSGASSLALLLGVLVLALLGTLAVLRGRQDGAAARDLVSAQRFAPDVLETLPLPLLSFEDEVPSGAPERIVCVIPSLTEALFAIGLGDRLVARDAWSDWPPEARALPDVGFQQSLDLEQIADLRPDLVVWWSHLPEGRRVLESTFGLNVVCPSTEGREEVFHGIVAVAAACGVRERGEDLVRRLESGLDDLRRSRSGGRKPRALLVLDRGDVLWVPGRESFLQDLFEIAGAENVAAGLDAGRWPTVLPEQVLEWDPDVIVDVSIGEGGERGVLDGAAFWARFDDLRAVRERRVVIVDGAVLVRPGPRMVAAAEVFARMVHGGP